MVYGESDGRFVEWIVLHINNNNNNKKKKNRSRAAFPPFERILSRGEMFPLCPVVYRFVKRKLLVCGLT